MKVLHILDHYKPRSDGYVYRSQYILSNQRALGLEAVVVTSPKQGAFGDLIENCDSVTVYRTPNHASTTLPFLREIQLVRHLRDQIDRVIRQERPNLLHAHSPSLNGVAALLAARKHRLPVVYEVRALWEDAAVDQGKWGENSIRYFVSRHVETELLRRVDAVFTICAGLKEEISRRGIPAGKITLIRNCVDSQRFMPQPPDTVLLSSLGLSGKTVLGFIGSFFDFEGLDLLLDAYRRLRNSRTDLRLVLVGDGIERKNLEAKARELGLGESVVFVGSVPHAEVLRYYSIIDILAYPRKSLRITELVTPLKPLEAMAMGKLVVGSDVGGMKELITHGATGFLFRSGDVEHLTFTLQDVLKRADSLSSMRAAAMARVDEKHNWKKAVAEYVPVYEQLLTRTQR